MQVRDVELTLQLRDQALLRRSIGHIGVHFDRDLVYAPEDLVGRREQARPLGAFDVHFHDQPSRPIAVAGDLAGK